MFTPIIDIINVKTLVLFHVTDINELTKGLKFGTKLYLFREYAKKFKE